MPFPVCRRLNPEKSWEISVSYPAIVFIGRIPGILFRWFGAKNYIVVLYILNTSIVSFDLILTIKCYKKSNLTKAWGYSGIKGVSFLLSLYLSFSLLYYSYEQYF